MLTNTKLAHLRLHSQSIAGPLCTDPAEVVRSLGAMQAQDYHQAVWAIGLRTQQATLADVEQAIEERKILRTWPMRGTIHFVPAEDARWMVQLGAARMIAADKRRQGQLELDAAILERCQALFYDALHGGKRLSRASLLQVLEDAGISTAQQRGYHILWHAAQIGLICLGPMQDKQQTFVLLDEWVPNSRQLSREEALAELARRYWRSHGPATVHDFAWWTGLTVTDAKAGLAAAKPELIAETINGKEYWITNDPPVHSLHDPSDIYLLAGFDEYLLGYQDRSAVLAPEHATRVVPGNNGIFFPIIVVAGQVVGTWKRSFKKNGVDIVLSPFAQLDVAEERVIEAAKRYSDFLGLPLAATTIRGDQQ